ncbi:hypothetical protein TI39_contig336g00058 [Zymoseptoria brevis]|uniref:Uncharacterized protein n=1 Tax=Zymoseptoria brevis TaxID=1047168 RepID=A0A0F4GS96_9PEZI|nr:hypothetical protein TI39_contig336g00058 [Zymoseptoria brevis]
MARTKIVPHRPHYHPAKKNDPTGPRRHNIKEAANLPPAKVRSADKNSHTMKGRLTSPESSNKTSLLDLALELRNRIYGHLLMSSPTKVRIASVVRGNSRLAVKQLRSRSTVAPSVSILLTCRQIHREATPMLYDNYFGLQSGSDAEIFLHKIGHSVKYLRHIRIQITASPVPIMEGTADAGVWTVEGRGRGIWEVLKIAPAKGLEVGFEQLVEEWETTKYEDTVKLALYKRMA